MDFFRTISYRWSKEEMQNWPSIRKTAYILLPLLLYLLTHDIAEILLWAGMELLVSHLGEQSIAFIEKNSYTFQGIINALAIVVGVVTIWLMAAREINGEEGQCILPKKEKQLWKKMKTSISLQRGRMVIYVLLVFFAAAAAIGLNALFGLLGVTAGSDTFSQVARQQYGVNFWIGMVLYGVFSPFAEETVFRGIIFNRMKRCFGYRAGLIFSALLFGLYHGNTVQALYGMLLGLLIACIYERYESFVAPVLFHSAANLSVFALTYGNSFQIMDKKLTLMMAIISLSIAFILAIAVDRIIKKSKTDKKTENKD